MSTSQKELERQMVLYKEKCDALSDLMGNAMADLREIDEDLSGDRVRPIELPRTNTADRLSKVTRLIIEVTTMSVILTEMGAFDNEVETQ